MTTSLFRYERIKTTKAKALEIRRTAEKMITRAKEDSVHNRREIGKDIKDKEILAKLFTELGPRYKERPGGYTRILKLGYRQGDAAEMVLLELVEEGVTEQKKGKKKPAKKTKAAKKPAETAAKEDIKEEAPAEESVEEETSAEETTAAAAAAVESAESVEAEKAEEAPAEADSKEERKSE